jgi:hypothetical protein
MNVSACLSNILSRLPKHFLLNRQTFQLGIKYFSAIAKMFSAQLSNISAWCLTKRWELCHLIVMTSPSFVGHNARFWSFQANLSLSNVSVFLNEYPNASKQAKFNANYNFRGSRQCQRVPCCSW